MIGYVTLGTNNLQAAAKFYDELLGVIGGKRYVDIGHTIAWSAGVGKPGFGIEQPQNQLPATVGNGVMVALIMESREKVDAIYNKAVELGGAGDSAPAQRFTGFYAAYFSDLDGNKLNAYFMA